MSDRLPARAGRQHRQQCFDIRQRRTEVHDACAQREVPVDHRLREKRLAASLHARQQVLVQALQIRVGLGCLRPLPIVRYAAKRRDDREKSYQPAPTPMAMASARPPAIVRPGYFLSIRNRSLGSVDESMAAISK